MRRWVVVQTTERRYDNLDVVRAVAALAVVWAHGSFLDEPVPFHPEFFTDLLLRQLGSAVWLFFVLSGFLISRPFVHSLIDGTSITPVLPYAVRRAVRILPAYWIALTAGLLLVGTQGAKAWQLAVEYGLVFNLVPGRQYGTLPVTWTLTIELLFYMAVPVIALAIRGLAGRRPIRATSFAAGVAVSWIASIAYLTAMSPTTGVRGPWLQTLLPGVWCYFCPGILLAVATRIPRTSRWHTVLVRFPSSPHARAAAAAFVVLAVTMTYLSTLDGLGLVEAIARYNLGQQLYAIGYGLVVGAALAARPWHERFGGWMLELGRISYGIYLYHAVFVLWFTTDEAQRFIPLPHGGVGAYTVHVALLLALTLPVAWLSWHLVERPLNDAARRWGHKRSATVDSDSAGDGGGPAGRRRREDTWPTTSGTRPTAASRR